MKYEGQHTQEISFPLGGIGTGCIGLAGDGRLIDWEIFNRPNKGGGNGYTHFAIRAIRPHGHVETRILCGDMLKNLTGQYKHAQFTGFGFGADKEQMCGFPHFRKVTFEGQFPMATVTYEDDDFPARVKLHAFNPFIPLDAENSSIPAAFFTIEVEQLTKADVEYQIVFAVRNPFDVSRNEALQTESRTAITMRNAGAQPDDIGYGDLTVAVDSDHAYPQTYWYRGGWQDGIVTYWRETNNAGNLADRQYDNPGHRDHCTLAADIPLVDGRGSVRYVLAWNVPYNHNDWSKDLPDAYRRPWKNYYAAVYADSRASAGYALDNFTTLQERTERFRQALYERSGHYQVIEAAGANLSVLKSPTVWRLEDGSFYGWEGVHEHAGSCEGTCQHVWNYAYALCFLFPELERSIRENEFRYSTHPDGKMTFRMALPQGAPPGAFRACIDGQMGAVIKCCREWKISGDDDWLRHIWPDVVRVLSYAWSPDNPDRWDADHDGVAEGRQHHTLDMELFGPSAWLEGMYLAALAAACDMAEYLGDTEHLKEYRALLENGRRWTRENLFNGRCFIQDVNLTDKEQLAQYEGAAQYWNEETGEIKYQVGEGSAIDQLLGQWHADIIGLGDIFDREQVAKALRFMMQHNYKATMREHANPWRVFSLDDERGTVICDYPSGTHKPAIPIPYCEETMTGFEYAFAGLLCSRAMETDAERVVTAVRDRFDGRKRNPWNEFECGSNYARSMASFALVPLAAGMQFDLPHKHIGFQPVDDPVWFNTLWSLGTGWGVYRQTPDDATVEVYEGSLLLRSVKIPDVQGVTSVVIDGNPVVYTVEGERICFDERAICQHIKCVYF